MDGGAGRPDGPACHGGSGGWSRALERVGFHRREQDGQHHAAVGGHSRGKRCGCVGQDPVGEYDAAAGLLANTADPAERELIIDKLRWNFIEEQLVCKEFHFDALCAYRLKLAIVNKYRNRKLEPGRKTFDIALERLSREAFRQE